MKEAQHPVVTLLTEIRDDIRHGNELTSRLATNAKTIRQDVSAIREGRTGADERLRKDPLERPKRRQVELVKERYREKSKANPFLPLLPISRAVRREDAASGITGGYATDLALNSRAWLEIKREDNGEKPF